MKQIKEIEFTETFGPWQEPGKRDSIQVEHCPIPSLGANSVSHISMLRIEGLFLPVSLIQYAIHPPLRHIQMRCSMKTAIPHPG
jgi:hypothetical protein